MRYQVGHEPHPNPLQAINIPALLHALSSCESGNDDRAIGRRGERGRYQIRRAVWDHYGRGIFELEAHREPSATMCAQRYLTMLARSLLDHEIVPNVTDLATLWNQGTLMHGHNDFSNRVTNLYYDTVKSQTSKPSAPILQTRHHR